MTSLCVRETVWEAFQEKVWARVIASQKLSRDSGETRETSTCLAGPSPSGKKREQQFQPDVYLTKFFFVLTPTHRFMDVCALGSWMSAPRCWIFQGLDLEAKDLLKGPKSRQH